VPKAHVPVLAELSPDQMGDVLAGLSTLARAVREICGFDEVGIETHPNRQVDGGHLHFHPVLDERHRAILAETGQERETDEKVLLAIAEFMAGSGAGYVLGEAT
jgi:diadenosine tetraphosphate (Ap4A) HIT family hydrolase